MSEYLISSGGAVLACARCNAEWTGPGHVCTDLAAMKRALDAADADRDYWHAQATMAAPCVDAVRATQTHPVRGDITARSSQTAPAARAPGPAVRNAPLQPHRLGTKGCPLNEEEPWLTPPAP